jgi:hypothetical protein
MPTNALLLALAAGLISTVVFASATTGPMLVRMLLFFLTPLSLYLAGLGLGPLAVVLAAIAATITILLLASPLTAVVYAATSALPAIVATRLALLSRGAGEEQEWYPVGRIIAAAAMFGGLFAVIILMLMGGDVEALTKVMRGAIDEFVKSQIASIPGAPAITEEQIDELAKTTLSSLPWVLGALAMATILLNLWLAGRITQASGRLVRPWPDLAAIQLPPTASLALFAALALTLVGGMPGLFAGGLAGALMVAFGMVGLAVAHTLTRGSPWRNFTLAGLYALVLFFTAPALMLLAIVGLAETVFGYRAQHGGGPPQAPN